MKTMRTKPHWTRCVGIAALVLSSLLLVAADAQAQAKKPNILVIMGDDIGWYNMSIYNRGGMGGCFMDWQAHRMFLLVPAQAAVGQWLESFKEFPPRAKAASFTVSDAWTKSCKRNQTKTNPI